MTLYAIPFPSIDPVLLSLGPFQVRWYALAYIAGILLAWYYMKRTARQEHLWPKSKSPASDVQIDDFILWATLGIIIGGRLGYVLFYNLDAYLANPSQIIAIWNGGMSFHGGFAGVMLALLIFAKRQSISLLSGLDLVALGAPFGLFFGRIANFINAELYGRITDMPWGVIFPNGGPLPRHPSQLYEAALEGLLLFIILRILSHNKQALQKPGLIAGTFALGYGLFRSFVELFRMPDAQLGFLTAGTTMGMWLSAPMILAGVALILYATKKKQQ
ncbi:MAG: prolipoprotein diacylglyceryl transferase [Cohaesibacter sp.]|nr:prolipoprotein diacylglyceryl transferase [Cohaesibacter sp.]